MADIIKKIVNFDSLIKLIFFLCSLNVLFSSFIYNVDYQDTWMLNNITISYALFVISYILLFVFEKNIPNLVFFAILIRVITLMIPNLKYDYFLGTSLDQHIQYLLSEGVINNGKIKYLSDVLVSGRYYVESPLFHLSISNFSIVTGLDLLNSFKYFPVALNIIYPLYFYSIFNKLSFKNQNYLRYSIFLSSIPMGGGLTYIVTGSMYMFIFLLGVINQYIDLIKSPNRINYVILILLLIGSIISHPIETLNYQLVFLAVSVIVNLFDGFKKDYLIKQIMVGIVINLGWMFLRESQFSYFGLLFLERVTGGTPVTPTFFLLLRSSIVGALKIITIYYGDDLFFSIFVLISLFYLYRRFREDGDIGYEYKFMVFFLFVVAGLTFVGLVLGIGMGYFARSFRNYYFIIVMFSGYFLNYLNQKTGKRILTILIILVALISSIKFATPPQMVPSASLVFPVEQDAPIKYSGDVNSIYQIELIKYTYTYFSGRIACDAVTRNQMISLTDGEYYDDYVTWYYPPILEIDTDAEQKEYEAFLIHYPGISGAYEERADIRDISTIIEQLYREDLDLVYSNSQSFLLYK